MAILKIYNDIVSEEGKTTLQLSGQNGVCFSDISDFIARMPMGDNKIDIRLHCRGGSTTEGWAIVDLLMATGKTIEATIEGTCASMASIILLAASIRKGRKNARLIIHDPYIPEYTLAGAYRADELRGMADGLTFETNRFLDFYSERTGADRTELETLMKEDREVSMEEAKRLGFIQEIIQPSSAKSERSNWNDLSINNKKSENMKDQNGLTAAFATIGRALGLYSVALELSTESGETLTIERSEGNPAVGDKAKPDGSHVMPDGQTIVIVDGVITEVKEKESGGESELDKANARIAELQKELSDAMAKNKTMSMQAKTTADCRILNAVAIAGGEDWLKTVASGYKPAGRHFDGSNAGVVKVSKVGARLAELNQKK